jgi:RNA polymerase sigma factor (sigma-70 family)
MARSNLSAVLNRLYQTTGQAAGDATDLQLLERFVERRDADAFTELVQRHGPMVFGVCRRLLREAHDAEDAFQATFLVLARKAGAIRNGESLASFLHGVAGFVARKMRVEAARRLRRERRHPAPAAAEDADALTWGELRSVLDEELGRLPARLRVPLILCYLEGQTQDEAARRLGWGKSTLRRRLERGRQLLRDRLAGRGVTLSSGLLAPLLSGPADLARTLTAGTVRAALAFGSGQPLGGGTPAPSVLLATSVLRGMRLTRIKVAAGVALVLSALAAGGLGAYRAAVESAPPAQAAQAPSGRPNRDEAKPASTPAASVDAFGDPLPEDAVARLGTVRLRHGSTPFAIDLSPDGRALASAGVLDGGAHIWETATGKEMVRISKKNLPGGVEEGVLGLVYAPDGKTLAAARMNQPPCLWDVATGKEVRQFGDWASRAEWVVFSPDGKTLAYGNRGQADPVVRLAEASTGNELLRLEGLKGSVTRAAFSPDGKTLAVADELAIHFFDRASGRRQGRPNSEDAKGRFSCLAFSPDGKTLAALSAANPAIRLLDVPTRKTLHTIATPKGQQGIRLAFVPDGKTLICGHEDGFVRFWDVASGAKARQFRAHSRTIVGLSLSRDGRTLATSCNSHVNGNHTVRLWETATGKPLVRYGVPEEGIARVTFSPDGRRVATASWDGAVCLWDAAGGALLRRWDLFGPLAFTADGKTLVCGGWGDGKVHLLDLASGKEIRRFQAHAEGIWDLCLSHDGKVLATAGMDEFLRLWDPATGRQLQDFGGKQKAAVLHVALTPDGKRLAATSFDHAVRVWDAASGKLVREHREADNLGGLAMSADGKLLAWSGFDGGKPSIRVCDLVTLRPVCRLDGHGDPLGGLAFAPDGRSLLWGGQFRPELYLFEVATGQLRRKFSGHKGHLSCVACSPSGRLMASGGSDGCVLIWGAAGQRQPTAPTPLREADLDRLWADLAANDAATAYGAICTLRASPRQAVGLLERHLKPAPAVDAKQVAHALRDLDSDQFAARERAVKELAQVAEGAEATLRQALNAMPSAEARRHLEQLLDQIEASAAGRRQRALELLEQIDSAESRRLLKALAHGAPGARLTRAAQAALDRSGGAPE